MNQALAHRLSQNDTVVASYRRIDGELRVTFQMPAQGFTLEQLDALQVAIAHAQRHLRLAAPSPELPLLPVDDSLQARHFEKLRHMLPVPG